MKRAQTFDPAKSFLGDTARRYDDFPRGDEAAAAQFLRDEARGGHALEFAIGTGRIALPLQALGVAVDGIELSPDMLKRLRAKPGGRRIHVMKGDMSAVNMGRSYALVYLVYNTIFNLLTMEGQIRCFANAARHLAPGGSFVVEAALPHAWIPPGKSQYVYAEHVGLDTVGLDVARYDPVTQLLHENHMFFTARGVRMGPIVTRLITPGEMDVMAHAAGLTLSARYANWQRAPFDSDSVAHVSVWRRDAHRQPEA